MREPGQANNDRGSDDGRVLAAEFRNFGSDAVRRECGGTAHTLSPAMLTPGRSVTSREVTRPGVENRRAFLFGHATIVTAALPAERKLLTSRPDMGVSTDNV